MNIEGTVGTKRSFYRHQQNIASNIRNITSSVISEAEEAEICATIFDILEGKGHSKLECKVLYSKWLKGEKVPAIGKIGLTVMFDMAWQKRGRGNRYDSISGHAIMIGALTKKVIGILVYAMKCKKCEQARKKSFLFGTMIAS